MRIGKNIVFGIIFIGLAVSLNACVVVVKGNSDEHARSHAGASFHYWYYYPNSRVYFHVTEHYYYYPDGNKWRRARQLPDGWALNTDYRVRVKLAGRPYRQQSLHQRQYPPKPTEARHHDDGKHGHGNKPPGNWRRSNNANQADDHKPDHANRRNDGGSQRSPDIVKMRKETLPGHVKSKAARDQSHDHPQHQSQKAGNAPPHRDDGADNAKGKSFVTKRGKSSQGRPDQANATSRHSDGPGKAHPNSKNTLLKAKNQRSAQSKNQPEHSAADKHPTNGQDKGPRMTRAKDNSRPAIPDKDMQSASKGGKKGKHKKSGKPDKKQAGSGDADEQEADEVAENQLETDIRPGNGKGKNH